jgi:peptidoglycan hydrolase-like protein with peptidoglycan-binding domain
MKCDDTTIDGLLAGAETVESLGPGDTSAAVGHLQDLLRGHGYRFVPDARAVSYRVYGSETAVAVRDYQMRHGLPAGDDAGSALLRDLVTRPAPGAAVSPAYLPLVLDVQFTSILRCVWLTSLFESGGAFQNLNLNSDQCGVSFGILQWSQKAGQLHKILEACQAREPAEWVRIMEGDGILEYTARPDGGVDARGEAVDAAFELTRDPWKSKLRDLGASLPMRRVQISLAGETYAAQATRQSGYSGEIKSERGRAFLLDLANQFGQGRVEEQFKTAARPGVAEDEILKALEDVFTGIARAQFRPQVRARRAFFRTTPLLSDQPSAD